ncbi:transposase, partial [Bacteroides sp. KG156]
MKALDKTISFLASQIESLESELADLASSEFDRQVKLLTSIKGIGITLATALIVATGGFSYFNNAKQVSRFIGICPTYQQS